MRYICGGEEGRSEVGSGWVVRGALRRERAARAEEVRSAGEVGDEAAAATSGAVMLGGGAPFTIWSSLDSDMVVVMEGVGRVF